MFSSNAFLRIRSTALFYLFGLHLYSIEEHLAKKSIHVEYIHFFVIPGKMFLINEVGCFILVCTVPVGSKEYVIIQSGNTFLHLFMLQLFQLFPQLSKVPCTLNYDHTIINQEEFHFLREKLEMNKKINLFLKLISLILLVMST